MARALVSQSTIFAGAAGMRGSTMRKACLLCVFCVFRVFSCAQGDPKLEPATAAVLHAFETSEIVMFGEVHGSKQEYEWLSSLVCDT
jgi:hypothetical protein